MIMTIANRLRGTFGWFAKVFGALIFLVSYYFTGSVLISLLFGVGYWIGELICGWGDHVGNITVRRFKEFLKFPEDGSEVGIRWLTSVITHPKLWKLHIENAKRGIYNWYPKIINTELKGYSLAKLFKISVERKDIETFNISNPLLYSRVFLFIRGLAWWLFPMIGVALLFNSVLCGLIGLLVLAIGFPICAELGYIFRDKISISKFGLSFVGGWELQEGFYGIWQDLVLIAYIVWYYINF